MGEAVRLYRAARDSLGQALGDHEAGRTVLSMFFKAIVGVERIFHFETLDDPGFALLTGGTKVLDRTTLGAKVRQVTQNGVRQLMAKTRPVLEHAEVLRVSIDEHSIARFSKKFAIPKGFHTIRNKKMKVEKLFFTFNVARRELISLISTPGDRSLAEVARQLPPALRRQSRGAPIRLIVDAGAAENHADLLRLIDHPNQVTIVRVPRRKAYRELWKKIPDQQWTMVLESGPFTHAALKVVYWAETLTRFDVDHEDGTGWMVNVRTIVVREQGRRGKERWHALWVFGDKRTGAWDIVEEFRQRQHHEQTYRVLVHDAFVDTAASGYDKDSPDVEHPRFDEGALSFSGWMAAHVVNVVSALTQRLPQAFHRAHLRTIRRWFFAVPGDIYLGSGTVIVLLHPRRLHATWEELILWTNRRRIRVPWLEDRRLVLSMSELQS